MPWPCGEHFLQPMCHAACSDSSNCARAAAAAGRRTANRSRPPRLRFQAGRQHHSRLERCQTHATAPHAHVLCSSITRATCAGVRVSSHLQERNVRRDRGLGQGLQGMGESAGSLLCACTRTHTHARTATLTDSAPLSPPPSPHHHPSPVGLHAHSNTSLRWST